MRSVVAFSAVGSLREEIRPEDFVVPDQVIDRTKGIRPFTFFEGGVVGHIGFADPFDLKLHKLVCDVSKTPGILEGGSKVIEKGTLVCMEGPQFSTRAESHMYRSWGCDVINMSCLPESKLALEAEMAYVMVCMATDYDSWRGEEGDSVNVAMVMKHMANNAENAKRFLATVLDGLVKAEHKDLAQAKHLEGSASGFVTAGFVTHVEAMSPETKAKLQWLYADGKTEK